MNKSEHSENHGLHRVGTARRVGANCSVVFHRVRCQGCDGRCGLSVGGCIDLPLVADLPNGATVEVVASAGDLARRALGVFGWPLVAVVAASAIAEWRGAGEALVVAALLGTALAVVGTRAALARPEGVATRVTRRATNRDESVRVVLAASRNGGRKRQVREGVGATDSVALE